MHMKTQLSKDFINEIIRGINEIASLVKSTMGAKGRYILIKKRTDDVYATKDGVSVADAAFVSSDPYGAGIDIVQQAARTTVDKVGDGTTLTTVLVQGFILRGYELIKKGVNPVALKSAMNVIVNDVINFVNTLSVKITTEKELIDIATISANNDKEIGNLIGSTLWKSGIYGDIKVEPSFSSETYIKQNTGYTIQRGYATQESINYDRGHDVRYSNSLIALYNQKIQTFDEIEDICSYAVEKEKPLVILAHGFSTQVLGLINLNNNRGTKFTAIQAPVLSLDFKNDILDDIAMLAGGSVLPNQDIDRDIHALGEFEFIHIKANETSFYDGKGNKELIEKRIDEIRNMDLEKLGNHVKTEAAERLAKLTNGLATLHVGGETDIKLRETLDRIEDSIKATKSALRYGYVPGGGIALLRASQFIKPLEIKNKVEQKAAEIVKDILTYPIETMLNNAGLSAKEIIKTLYKPHHSEHWGQLLSVNIVDDCIECVYNYECPMGKICIKGRCDCDIYFLYESDLFGTELYSNVNWGYNIISDEYGDMINLGIIDPTEVITQSLKSAYSVAETLLTCDGIIYEQESN